MYVVVIIVGYSVGLQHYSLCSISIREGSTAGQQCCYKSNGELLVGPNSGGTVDRYAPVDFKTFWQHQWFDVIPAILCCKGLFSDCSKYYDRRPSHNGDDCSPTPPGQLHVFIICASYMQFSWFSCYAYLCNS